MRIRLTDKQIVLLEWDRRPCLQQFKSGREFDVDASDLDEIRTVAETLSWGADGGTIASAKSLLRKLDDQCKPS